MAIAHDTHTRFPTTGDGDTTAGDRTFSHTPTGTPAGVVVVIVVNANSAPVTGVLYGGTAMTLAESANDATNEAGRCVVYTLTDQTIATGTQTVTLQGCSTVDKIAVCFTVTSATDQSTLNDSAQNVQNTTNPTLTFATSEQTMLYGGYHHGASAIDETANSGTTVVTTTGYAANHGVVCRSTNPVASGTPSLAFTDASDNWAFAGAALAELASSGTNANATTADSTVTSFAATGAIKSSGGSSDVTTLANNPSADVKAHAGFAEVTLLNDNETGDIEASATTAEVTVTANDATVTTESGTDANATTAEVAATANNPTVTTQGAANAETAEVQVAALNPQGSVGAAAGWANVLVWSPPTAESNVAPVAVTAFDATVDIQTTGHDANAEVADAQVVANNSTIKLDASGLLAAVTATAENATVSTSGNANALAGVAELSVVANGSTTDIKSSPSVADLTVSAFNPSVDTSGAKNALAECAEVAVSSLDISGRHSTGAQIPEVTVTANNPNVVTGSVTYANAGVAEVSVTAEGLQSIVSASAGTATVTGTTNNPGSSVSAPAGAAELAVSAESVDAIVGASAGSISVLTEAFGATPTTSAFAQAGVASVVMLALNPTAQTETPPPDLIVTKRTNAVTVTDIAEVAIARKGTNSITVQKIDESVIVTKKTNYVIAQEA